MVRILLRVSGVLFALTGGVAALLGWFTTHASYNSSYWGITPHSILIDLAITIGLCAGGGFALLISQERAQRHWLGWLGIALTLLGLASSTIAIVVFYTGESSVDNSKLPIIVYLFAEPLYAVGLIFWSLDLPNTSTSLLLQKGVMSLIGVLPFFTSWVLQFGLSAFDSDRIYLIDALLVGGLWCLLGGSVWFYRAPTAHFPLESRSHSFADSSFDLVVSPIPPGDM